ncbi:MAG: response regulator transcription factor [Phycisphaerales bacterium]|nr:response regulator transcription factor [Phycisphaerales bacterium]
MLRIGNQHGMRHSAAVGANGNTTESEVIPPLSSEAQAINSLCADSGLAPDLARALLADSHLPLVVCETTGEIVFASRATGDLLGVSAGSLVGGRLPIAGGPEAEAERQGFLRRAGNTGRPTLILEVIAGMPCRTVVRRMSPASGADGQGLLLCIFHTGPASAETAEDHAHYEVVHARRGPRMPTEDLTEAELRVLRLIAMGHTSGEIGRLIHRSVKTVEWHRSSLGRKLGLSTRIELTRFAHRQGLVDLGGVTLQAPEGAAPAAPRGPGRRRSVSIQLDGPPARS